MSSYTEDENTIPRIIYDDGKIYQGKYPIINLYYVKLENIGPMVQRRINQGYKYMITLCFIDDDFINQDYLYIKTQEELMLIISGYKIYDIKRKIKN